MSLQAKYLKIRLFVEGIELPCISAMMQASINNPAVCSVQVVPLDSLVELKPKSLVHVFFYDFLDERDVDPNDFKRYKLLFCGEIVGFSYTKSGLGRSAVLQCADLTNNWNRAYQYMLTYGPNGNFLTPEASNYAAGTNKFNNIVDGHLGVLGRYLRSQPKTIGLQNVKGLLGGIITLIEEFGGVRGHTRGVLDYFTVAELKNKTMQQVTADEKDNTSQQLFDAKEFYEWLENGLTQLGELCSLWDMIRLLFQYIYYEYSPVTSPLYIPGSIPDTFEDADKVNKILEEVYVSLYDDKDLPATKLRASNAKNNLLTVSEYQAISADQKSNITKAVASLDTVAVALKYSEKIQENLTAAKGYVKSAMTKLDKSEIKNIRLERLCSILFKPECYFVAAPTCNVVFPEQNTQFSFTRNYEREYTRLRLQSGMMFNIDQEKLFADFTYAPSGKEIREVAQQQGVGKRLSAVLPWEKFTGVLPKFEYIQDINYVVNKRQKELNKNVKTTKTVTPAKKTASTPTQSQGSGSGDLQKAVQNLAKNYKQRAANFNFYKYRFQAREMSGSCRFNPMLVVGFPMVVLDRPFMVDREKLIDLAKQRGTDINKITQQDIIDNIKDFAATLGAPNQYIGYPTTISHMVGQDGASTSFTCSHARPHRVTGDDFLQIYKGQVEQKQLGTFTSRILLDSTVLAKNQDFKLLKYLIDLTPQQPPQKTDVKPDLPRPQLQISGFDVTVPDFRATIKTEPGDYVGETQESTISGAKIRIPIKYGKIQPNSKGKGINGGTIVAIRVVNDLVKKINFEGQDYYVWSSVLVYEELENQKVYKTLPIEEILRPNWFSAQYSNLTIGEQIYGKFIGCGSVVDELVLKNSEGLAIQSKSTDRLAKLDKLAASENLMKDVAGMVQNDISDVPSMESAIDILAFIYGEVLKNGGDVNRFISDYTTRSIATMEDILGSSDLELTKIGNDVKVARGKLGFHSVAVSGFSDLAGLVSDPSLPLINKTGQKETIPPSVDPRPERKAAIQKYEQELQISSEEIIGLIG